MAVPDFMRALYPQIQHQVQIREAAKVLKDYGHADTLRDVLLSIRVGSYRLRLEDRADGTTDWAWTTGPG